MTRIEFNSCIRDNAITLKGKGRSPGLGWTHTLEITFQRTIRVPDNSNVSKLPPDLGRFPLYKVKDYATRLPKDMADKGGVFFPMHRKYYISITPAVVF